jgi:hypothetical protein
VSVAKGCSGAVAGRGVAASWEGACNESIRAEKRDISQIYANDRHILSECTRSTRDGGDF